MPGFDYCSSGAGNAGEPLQGTSERPAARMWLSW